jgi:superfamily II DNA or RNA helicase
LVSLFKTKYGKAGSQNASKELVNKSMLNEDLPRVALEKSLQSYLDNIDWILLQIDPERDSIINDKSILAKLHHSLFIDQYSKFEFRYQLLYHGHREKIKKLLRHLKWKQQRLPQNDKEYEKLIRDLASFEWGNNARTKAFIEAFDYPILLIPSEDLKPGKGVQHIPKANNPYRMLKDYQSQIFFDAASLLETANQRFLIQMPTGAGKTRVAMELISFFLNNQNKRQVLWIADREELCQQAIDTFLSCWPHVSKFDLSLYGIWGDALLPDNFEPHSFIVTMYQKIRNPIKDKKIGLKPDLIIVDEAHNVLAPTYQKILEELQEPFNKQTRIIGLSATPGRTYEDSPANTKLADFFNTGKVEIKAGDKGVIKYLQDKGILSRVRRKEIDTELKYELTKDEWQKFAKYLDYPDQLLKRIANDQRRNLIITMELLRLVKENRQVLFFASSVEQSKLLCGLMLSRGYNAAHIDGTSPSSYRKDVVNKFRIGDITFIFNYGIFAAGFDAPNIDTIFIARPTTSIVLYSQMIGRGMRGPEIGGTSELLLVDVVDQINTEGLALDDVYDYFSDYWR